MVSASHLKISEPISQLKVPVVEMLKIDSSVVTTSDGVGVNVLEEIKSDHFPYVEHLTFSYERFPEIIVVTDIKFNYNLCHAHSIL